MFELDSVLMDNPYSLCDKDKQKLFLLHIKSLIKHHYDNSVYYNRILNHLKYNIKNDLKLSQLPFIPVRLFKYYDLISVNKHDIFKQITSSGTTSNNVSNIYLNKETAELQTRVLTKIITY